MVPDSFEFSFDTETEKNSSNFLQSKLRRVKGFWDEVIIFCSLIAADAFSLLLAITISLGVNGKIGDPGSILPSHLPTIIGQKSASLELATIELGVILYFLAHGHYRKRSPFWTEAQQIFLVSFYAMVTCVFTEVLLRGKSSTSPPTLAVCIWMIFPFSSVLMRRLIKYALDWAGLWQIDVLLVGNNLAVAEAKAALTYESMLGYRIAGTLSLEQLAAHGAKQCRYILEQHGARRLVIALESESVRAREVVKELVRARVPFSVIPQIAGMPVSSYDPVEFFNRDTVLLSYHDNLSEPGARVLKGCFDVILASLLLAFLAAPMLLLALLIRLDGGPALFAHERVGVGGRNFGCLKFRTMVVNADRVLAELLESDPLARAEWTATHKLSNDPRVTPIGRILRATSIDELPQLINVIRFDMSLVGPRPIERREVLRYADDIAYYYDVKPGLTGLWQVSGRSNTTYDRRVELDRWYVRNWTIWHDIAILVKTVPTVLSRRGAR
jgi:undecaprenyl-phosphate galactose phosphotransferase